MTLHDLQGHATRPDPEFCRAKRARNVRVFGSVARGESDAQSDIDFLVDLEPGRSLRDLIRLQRELETLLARKVDVVSSHGLRERVRQRILQEAVPL